MRCCHRMTCPSLLYRLCYSLSIQMLQSIPVVFRNEVSFYACVAPLMPIAIIIRALFVESNACLTSAQALLPSRSEEHTSELQSQSISYAVFCLKKNKRCLMNDAVYLVRLRMLASQPACLLVCRCMPIRP